MSVYFVHCRETDAVKIGFAEDAWKRIPINFRADNPCSAQGETSPELVSPTLSRADL